MLPSIGSLEDQVAAALGILPEAAAAPMGICDAKFHQVLTPGHYAIKTNPAEFSDFYVKIAGHADPITGKFGCSHYTHVTPYKGMAVIQAGDVGKPEAVLFKPVPGTIIPSKLLVKKVGGGGWVPFRPRREGTLESDGSTFVNAERKPTSENCWYSDKFYKHVPLIHKQFGIEWARSFLPPATPSRTI